MLYAYLSPHLLFVDVMYILGCGSRRGFLPGVPSYVFPGLVCPASMAALLQAHCQVGSGFFYSSTSFGSPGCKYANSRSNLPVNMDFLGPGVSQFALVPVLCIFQLQLY